MRVVSARRGAYHFGEACADSDVEELADRIGVISKGKLIFVGSIQDLRKELADDGKLEDLFLQLTEEGDEEVA